MPTHKSKFTSEKPWSILGISCKQYATTRPWKKAGMSKGKCAEMLNLMPHEAMKILKDEVDAERLVESIFGSQG